MLDYLVHLLINRPQYILPIPPLTTRCQHTLLSSHYPPSTRSPINLTSTHSHINTSSSQPTLSDGFCTGLAKSKVFVPLLSKEGINHPDKPWQNFSKLTETSPCDNVFLEYRMALDLCQRGLVDKVFPVFFPDAITKASYTFRAGLGVEASHPICPSGKFTIIE